jgi:hypothetical protein
MPWQSKDFADHAADYRASSLKCDAGVENRGVLSDA